MTSSIDPNLDRWHTWGIKIDGCFHFFTTTHRPSIEEKAAELKKERPLAHVEIAPFRLTLPRWEEA